MIGHGAAALEMGVGAVAEQRAIVDTDSLDVLQLVHVLIRHIELFDLREEVRTRSSDIIHRTRRRQGRSLTLRDLRSGLLLELQSPHAVDSLGRARGVWVVAAALSHVIFDDSLLPLQL